MTGNQGLTVPQAVADAMAAGRMADAERLLREIMALRPDDMAALLGFGLLALRVGKPAAARPVLEQVVVRSGGDVAATTALASACGRMGHHADGVRWLEFARARHNGSAAHQALSVALARACLTAGAFADAETVLAGLPDTGTGIGENHDGGVAELRRSVEAHRNKQVVRIGFADFYDGYGLDAFCRQFDFLTRNYFFVLDTDPDVLLVSCFGESPARTPDGRAFHRMPPRKGRGVMVFLTGENVEPDMAQCDFAISFSTLVDDDRHLRLPLWVYDLPLKTGLTASALIKAGWDIDDIIRRKQRFCAYVQSHSVAARDGLVRRLARYKPVDCAGNALNNTGWVIGGNSRGKIDFLRGYKFAVAFENDVWPGYTTEKLVEPMLAQAIPVYWGNPLVGHDFNPKSFINLLDFPTVTAAIDAMAAIDGDQRLYAQMLAEPWFAGNTLPDYATPQRIAAFFERIFQEARQR